MLVIQVYMLLPSDPQDHMLKPLVVIIKQFSVALAAVYRTCLGLAGNQPVPAAASCRTRCPLTLLTLTLVVIGTLPQQAYVTIGTR